MFERIKRLFRAMFGWLLGKAEDPEVVLRQLREDLRNKIPELNRQVAEIIKHEKMLAMELERKTDLVVKLRPQVEAAVKAGPTRKDAALTLIGQLKIAEADLAETQAALGKASENSKQMLKMRDAYEQKIRKQMDEAMLQISRHKRAQVESEMSEIMSSFQVGDETQTLEQMTERIDETMARAQARMDVAQTSVTSQLFEIEQDAQLSESETMYAEYQRQLGLVPETVADVAPEKTMEAIPVAEETVAPPPVQAAAAPAAPPPMPAAERQTETEQQ